MLSIAVGAAVIGFVIGLLTVALFLVVSLLLPAKQCEGCGQDLPKIRRNPNRLEALRGIARCLHCGCAVDWRGRKTGPPRTAG